VVHTSLQAPLFVSDRRVAISTVLLTIEELPRRRPDGEEEAKNGRRNQGNEEDSLGEEHDFEAEDRAGPARHKHFGGAGGEEDTTVSMLYHSPLSRS
jgi:hypothetical protein